MNSYVMYNYSILRYEDYYLNGVSVQRAGYSAIMVAMKKKIKYSTSNVMIVPRFCRVSE